MKFYDTQWQSSAFDEQTDTKSGKLLPTDHQVTADTRLGKPGGS